MTEPVIVDATEVREDAIRKFVDAFVDGRDEIAMRFLELAFYLNEHRVEAAR
jgi:hypothetical protein